MSESSPLITLLSDFGQADPYVGSMKGAIYEIAPKAVIVDICHDISPQNVLEAAFVIQTVYQDYPKGTIFLCVVDPGVGTTRLPLFISTGNYRFIGPDNGIFSYILSNESVQQSIILDKEEFFRHPVSKTFHGRDIFAPCAGWLARGKDPTELGRPMSDEPHRLVIPIPSSEQDKSVDGQVMRVDHFGNLISNIQRSDLRSVFKEISQQELQINFSDWVIPFAETYQEGEEASLRGLWGSSGYLEVSARNSSAQDILDVGPGAPLRIERATWASS